MFSFCENSQERFTSYKDGEHHVLVLILVDSFYVFEMWLRDIHLSFINYGLIKLEAYNRSRILANRKGFRLNLHL